MKWKRDRYDNWPWEQPPSLLDELMHLLAWLIPLAVAGWTVIALLERKP